jgi:2-dehydropantoate 2-reductase
VCNARSFFVFFEAGSMHVVIIGAGALGSLFGARLAQAGIPVTLYDHNHNRAAALKNSVTLVEAEHESVLNLPVTAESACLKQAELILLCTKSADVEQGLQLIQQNNTGHPVLLGFQNGIHHIHAIARAQGGFAVTAQGATLLKPGVVRHGGNGATVIGTLTGNNDGLQPVAALLSSAHIPTTVTTSIENKLWQKLLINVGINGLTVLHDCANGELLNIPQAKEQLIQLVTEGETVACALGIRIDKNPVKRCLEVCTATATNISSMLQDYRNGKKSEIMAINGALVQKAQKAGIATPVNDVLIKEVEKRFLEKT